MAPFEFSWGLFLRPAEQMKLYQQERGAAVESSPFPGRNPL